MTVARFIRFEESFDLWRRHTWKVISKSQNAVLCRIAWSSEWNRFVMCDVNPKAEFSDDCLADIQAFMKSPDGKKKR